MTPILQNHMPEGQLEVAGAHLPVMRPVVGRWLFCDGVYGAQMALRRGLLASRPQDVYAQTGSGLAAARGFLEVALAALPAGFVVEQDAVIFPDGVRVRLDRDAPLMSVGQIVQQDVCILEKQGDEHVLSGAVLCFPASWTLAEKIGKPLMQIHNPVAEYDDSIGARVQRMFDGAQAGRAMWRANAQRYADAALFQPRTEADPRRAGGPYAPFVRSERQTVVRLGVPGAVAFVIHTTVVRV